MRRIVLLFALLPFVGRAEATEPLADNFLLLRPELSISVYRDFSTTPTAHACDPAGGYNLPLYYGSAFECETMGAPFKAIGAGFDAAGALYQIVPNFQEAAQDVVRGTATGTETVARLLTGGGVLLNLAVDSTNGRLYLAFRNDGQEGIVVISGLPTMFDTLLTFVPSGQALSTVTPRHPDGFRSADSVQVWTGDVRSMPDWSVATPLTCDAATSPAPGQVVMVPDTLPDPALGSGRYYITATRQAEDRRLGRQNVGGVLSARDPGLLPVCSP